MATTIKILLLIFILIINTREQIYSDQVCSSESSITGKSDIGACECRDEKHCKWYGSCKTYTYCKRLYGFKCANNCKECISQEINGCISCSNSSYLNNQVTSATMTGNCVSSSVDCSSNQPYLYTAGLNQQVFLIQSIKPYNISQDVNQCYSVIEQGTYSETATKILKICYSNCGSCDGPDQFSCLSCLPIYTACKSLTKQTNVECMLTCSQCKNAKYKNFDDTCVNKCSDGQFEDDYSQSCKLCNILCLTCQYTASNCQSCQEAYFLQSQNESGICQPCSDIDIRCIKCESSKFCMLCQTGYYLSILRDSCQEACNDYQYADQQDMKCAQCHSSCLTCIGYANNQCVYCRNTAQVKDFVTNKCTDCNSECKTCSGSPEQCTGSCQTGYHFSSKSPAPCCHSSCKECIGGQTTECKSCFADSQFVHDQSYSFGSCVKKQNDVQVRNVTVHETATETQSGNNKTTTYIIPTATESGNNKTTADIIPTATESENNKTIAYIIIGIIVPIFVLLLSLSIYKQIKKKKFAKVHHNEQIQQHCQEKPNYNYQNNQHETLQIGKQSQELTSQFTQATSQVNLGHLNQPKSEQKDDETCKICFEFPKTHVVIPCGHRYCKWCIEKIIDKDGPIKGPKLCAFCKRVIKEAYQIFD